METNLGLLLQMPIGRARHSVRAAHMTFRRAEDCPPTAPVFHNFERVHEQDRSTFNDLKA